MSNTRDRFFLEVLPLVEYGLLDHVFDGATGTLKRGAMPSLTRNELLAFYITSNWICKCGEKLGSLSCCAVEKNNDLNQRLVSNYVSAIKCANRFIRIRALRQAKSGLKGNHGGVHETSLGLPDM